MRILWLSHLLPFPPQGVGVLQRSANLLKAVASAHDVSLVAFNQKDLLRIYNPDLTIALSAAMAEMKQLCSSVKVFDIECDKKRFGKHRLAFSSLFSILPYTIRWLNSEKYNEALKDEFANNKYDIVWLDTISLAQYRNIFQNTNAKIILNHHNIESDMMFRRAKKDKSYLKKSYFYLEAIKLKKYEEAEVNNFDVNITCSKLDSQRLESISSGVNTYVIPNGVNTDYFSPQNDISPDPKSLVFIGGMSWYPNRDAMIFFAKEVWPELKKQISDITMHVVGESPPQELLDLAEIDNSFHVHGFVNDVKSIFYKSGIYVCPINDGGGTKLKILDALAMGKPIVANKIACEGIEVIDGLNVLFAERPTEYIDKISKLIADVSLREKLAINSRKLILEKYSYDVIGQELLTLLDRIQR